MKLLKSVLFVFFTLLLFYLIWLAFSYSLDFFYSLNWFWIIGIFLVGIPVVYGIIFTIPSLLGAIVNTLKQGYKIEKGFVILGFLVFLFESLYAVWNFPLESISKKIIVGIGLSLMSVSLYWGLTKGFIKEED